MAQRPIGVEGHSFEVTLAKTLWDQTRVTEDGASRRHGCDTSVVPYPMVGPKRAVVAAIRPE